MSTTTQTTTQHGTATHTTERYNETCSTQFMAFTVAPHNTLYVSIREEFGTTHQAFASILLNVEAQEALLDVLTKARDERDAVAVIL